jgi:ATP-dependent protease ClpP protease subunit
MRDFRFWGRIDPRGRQKPAILASVPAVEDGDGEAVMRLYDPIDSWGEFWGVSAAEFVEALAQVPADRAIRLHLNSPGGEVYDAIAILNALRAHRGTVTAVVDGIAASAASFIAAGVDRLVMQPNSELMIHDAWGIAIGPAETMRRMSEDLDRVSNNIASIYAGKAGTPVEDWRAAMLDETWYGAQAAVDAGLADEVGTGAVDDPALAAAARFDREALRAQRPAAPPIADRSGRTTELEHDAAASARGERFAAAAAAARAKRHAARAV